MTANGVLLAAGVLSIFVGFVHSILGEFLIFRRLRDGGIIPTMANPPLLEKHVRILWATWHIASIFGWAVGSLLLRLSFTGQVEEQIVIHVIAVSMFSSGLLVLIATKARHPGWLGLMGVAVLCWLV